MNPTISICVPVYGVANYFADCLRSLFEQTFADLEYVFVDDCTPDNSMAILDDVLQEYPNRRSQVRVIRHETNRGLAVARRTSIEAATGKYILCVDSDDTVSPDMAQTLYQKSVEEDADLVLAAYTEIRPNGHHKVILTTAPAHLCGKMILRERLEPHIFAPEGLDYLEDRYVMVRVFDRCHRIAIVEESLYNYHLRPGSVSSGKNTYHFQCLTRFWELTDQYFRETGQYENRKEEIAFQKVEDKAHLMLAVKGNAVRRQFADLYREEERRYMGRLRRGSWLMSHLVHYHLWSIITLYQLYINLVERIKNNYKS